MKIDHIALWVDDLETMRKFYIKYFGAQCNTLYVNSAKQYSSYFLSFGNDSSRLELMHRPDIADALTPRSMTKGWAHISFKQEGKKQLISLTERLRTDGYVVAGEPRTTGDGYFESVILDPEGNLVEIVA